MHKFMPTPHWTLGLTLMSFVLMSGVQLSADDDTQRPDDSITQSPPPAVEPIEWHQDYGESVTLAIDQQKLLLICFDQVDEDVSGTVARFAADDPDLATDLDEFVLVRLSVDTRFETNGEDRRLLNYSAFRDMENRHGIAVIDYKNLDAEQYGTVVSVYPLTESRKLSRVSLSTLLTLPAGTLTQRTLVLAVSLHEEKPKSVDADWDNTLADEVKSHSVHQARINLQGHHNWNSRFHRINGLLGNGLRAQEVCAESWPGQTLVDAAEECVDSWRHSSGHWSAVSGKQRRFAYDMKRGSNGVWYATGIFAR